MNPTWRGMEPTLELRETLGFLSPDFPPQSPPADSNCCVKGGLQRPYHFLPEAEASRGEEGRASDLGCAIAEPSPWSCLRPCHPAWPGTPPGLQPPSLSSRG